MTQDEARELRAYFETKFGAIDKRFDAVDGRLDGIDGRLDGIDGRLDGIDGRLDAMDVTMEREFGAITEQFVEQRRYVEGAYDRLGTRMTVELEKMRGDMRVMTERA